MCIYFLDSILCNSRSLSLSFSISFKTNVSEPKITEGVNLGRKSQFYVFHSELLKRLLFFFFLCFHSGTKGFKSAFDHTDTINGSLLTGAY